jgi:hypothetical protein
MVYAYVERAARDQTVHRDAASLGSSTAAESCMNEVSNYRRMSFAVVFAGLAAAVGLSAVTANSVILRVILMWIAANALTISVAYFTNSPGVYGKKEDGSIRWPVAFWMAPWLLFVRMVWHLQNIVSRTPLYSEIVPDLFVGRLCQYQSLPGDVSVVVDLTAEFPTPRSLRSKVLTICLPTLDGCAPDWKKCQQAFELIDNQSGRIYVCCANGHGRSVTFAAAWLGLQGKCLSAADSVKLIQVARPSAAPNRDQLSFLNNVFQIMKSVGPSTSD